MNQLTPPEEMVKLPELFSAHCQEGHVRREWNPRMSQFILGMRAGMHLIDLNESLAMLRYEPIYLAADVPRFISGSDPLQTRYQGDARHWLEEGQDPLPLDPTAVHARCHAAGHQLWSGITVIPFRLLTTSEWRASWR